MADRLVTTGLLQNLYSTIAHEDRDMMQWRRERPTNEEYYQRTEHIRRVGLPCRIKHVLADEDEEEKRGRLHMILIEPRDGWTHLMNDWTLEHHDFEAEPYHVSICFDNDLWYDDGWRDYKWAQMQYIMDTYNEWQNHTFQIDSFGNATANLAPADRIYRDVFPLFKLGRYGQRDGNPRPHISM